MSSAPLKGIGFGICLDQSLPWNETVELWQLFERLGFDSVWDCDHYQRPSNPSQPYFEAWTLLAALATKTSRIRIGVLVSSNTFRHPALLAKEAVTVDHISTGRMELGIGAGWFVPEHEAFGIPFPSAAELVGRFREAVEIVDTLMRNDVSSYEGTYYRLNDAPFKPSPVQKPRPPLTLGAHRAKMLRIVAEYADRWNSHGTVAEIKERNEILDEQCAAVGRDPRSIIRSLYGWSSLLPADPWESADAFHEVVGRYAEIGINEFIIDAPPPEQRAMMERIASDEIPKFR
jgi:F420-dependent oxidoreductase-like protein